MLERSMVRRRRPRRQMTCFSVMMYSTPESQTSGKRHAPTASSAHQSENASMPPIGAPRPRATTTAKARVLDETRAATIAAIRNAGGVRGRVGLPVHTIASPNKESRAIAERPSLKLGHYLGNGKGAFLWVAAREKA